MRGNGTTILFIATLVLLAIFPLVLPGASADEPVDRTTPVVWTTLSERMADAGLYHEIGCRFLDEPKVPIHRHNLKDGDWSPCPECQKRKAK